MPIRQGLKTAAARLGNGFKADSAPSEEFLRTTLRAIRDGRVVLHGQIDQAAHNGVIADALPLSLYANLLAEANEMSHQLVQAEQDYEASLRRLDAMFPATPPPTPEPPAPRPGHFFPRIGKLLSGKDAGTRH